MEIKLSLAEFSKLKTQIIEKESSGKLTLSEISKLKPEEKANLYPKNSKIDLTNEIPCYSTWDDVIKSNYGDTWTETINLSEVDCWLICGKDGKSENDYFGLVQLEDGRQVWIHHIFLHTKEGNKLHI